MRYQDACSMNVSCVIGGRFRRISSRWGQSCMGRGGCLGGYLDGTIPLTNKQQQWDDALTPRHTPFNVVVEDGLMEGRLGGSLLIVAGAWVSASSIFTI